MWNCACARILCLAASVHLGVSIASGAEPQGPAPLSRIALGSCIRQNQPQPIWKAIVATHPQLFLLMGDNIYGDTQDMKILRAKYAKLAARPGYQRLKATCPILAVWDDHDYGVNDGGSEYPQKVASQRVFNDFFGVPADSPRRQRPGIYDAHRFGPEGNRVQIILLDTRFFRGPLKKWPAGKRQTLGPYRPNPDPEATLLGDTQWQWLEQQLKVPAQLRIIVSSIQVVSDQHGWEMWANFPLQRQRLFKTIADSGATGVLFVSGDRHRGEISRLPSAARGVAYPLYDLTSSSLNQPASGRRDETNRFRIGQNLRAVNFGTIAIDWNQDDPRITLAIRDIAGASVQTQALSLSDLAPRK